MGYRVGVFLHFIENALGMNVKGLPTVTSTCKCLRMVYEKYDCLTNALLISSDLNADIAFSAVGCRFGCQNGINTTKRAKLGEGLAVTRPTSHFLPPLGMLQMITSFALDVDWVNVCE